MLPYDYSENYNNNINELNNNNITKNIENHKVNIVNDNKHVDITTSNYKSKYYTNDLCQQIIYQFSFINEIGMVSYKNIYSYEENINYNELPLMFENDTFEQDDEENNEEHTLVKSFTLSSLIERNTTNSYYNNNTCLNELDSTFTTPSAKKHMNYISYLRSEKKISQNHNLLSSQSSPNLNNDIDPKKLKSILKTRKNK